MFRVFKVAICKVLEWFISGTSIKLWLGIVVFFKGFVIWGRLGVVEFYRDGRGLVSFFCGIGRFFVCRFRR